LTVLPALKVNPSILVIGCFFTLEHGLLG